MLTILFSDQKGLGPEFIEAFRAGEEHAFDQIFRMYFLPLSLYAYRYLHDQALAEDIVQDCFADLWQKRKKLETVQSVNKYLYGIVHNKLVRYLETKARKQLSELKIAPVPGIEEAIIEAETLRGVVKVLDHLPPRMQQVLKLYYLEGKSLDEIGQAIGIDPETVRVHRYRAILFARKIIISG